jgi:hypothetical protein
LGWPRFQLPLGRGRSATREDVSEELDEVEETYDTSHPGFMAAWKADFPQHRFRVYYTQYDNSIVRFHMVRIDERCWLTDEELRSATEPNFGNAVIFDTDYLDRPVTKRDIRPN